MFQMICYVIYEYNDSNFNLPSLIHEELIIVSLFYVSMFDY
jgi:hypothetical protein